MKKREIMLTAFFAALYSLLANCMYLIRDRLWVPRALPGSAGLAPPGSAGLPPP